MARRSRTTVASGVVTALAVTVALSACAGQQSPPTGPDPADASASATATAPVEAPEDLLAQAMRNMREAPSKRIVGEGRASIASQEFDIVFVGEDAKGTQTARGLGIVSVVEFVKVGDGLYILASEHYWQNYIALEGLSTFSNRWVRVPADDPDHSSLLVLEGGSDSTISTSVPEPVGPITQVDTDTIDGVSAVVLEDNDGNQFWVSSEGTPYLLRLKATQTTEVGEITVEIAFSEFGTVTETIAVPEGEIIEVS